MKSWLLLIGCTTIATKHCFCPSTGLWYLLNNKIKTDPTARTERPPHLKNGGPSWPWWPIVPGFRWGNDFRHLLPDLDALEESLGCKLYRQWPICEAGQPRPSNCTYLNPQVAIQEMCTSTYFFGLTIHWLVDIHHFSATVPGDGLRCWAFKQHICIWDILVL